MSSKSFDLVFDTAKEFVGHLIASNYSQAYSLLDASQALIWSVPQLKQAWLSMLEDAESAQMMIDMFFFDPMDSSPAHQPSDIGWFYLPVVSSLANEAVSGVVVKTAEGLRLRTLEFGRP